MTLASVTDERPERREAVAARYRATRLFDDPVAMLDDADLDAVVIATPIGTHHALGVAALERGTSLKTGTTSPTVRRAVMVSMVD